MDRTCTSCKSVKDISLFAPRGDNPSKFRSHCKDCVRDQNITRHHTRPHTKAANASAARRHLLKRYGLTPESYDSMVQKQNGVCAICELSDTSRHLSVDHDHATGEVRGLLCQICNTAIGHFKDSQRLLARASLYLRGGLNA